jgi:isoleucyl-tRNA synthetase
VSDRIDLTLDLPDDLGLAVRAHETVLASETLATSVTYGPASGAVHRGEVDDQPVAAGIRRAG